MKSVFGIYIYVPSVFNVTAPFDGFITGVVLTVKLSPVLGSKSFVNT